jgi:single-strand DNA-binding protein
VSDGVNKVFLLGNLGADPELKVIASGSAVMNFRMVTDESYLDNQRVRQTKSEWHRVVVWGGQAEALGKMLSKGDKVHVEGSIQTRSYEDKEGNKRYTTEIRAQRVTLCGGRQTRQEERSGGFGGGAEEDLSGGEDIPF